MKYVYILESLDSGHFYVGITDDLRARLTKHNAGEVTHTSKYRPWKLRTYIAFSDEKRAFAFEKYLKSASRPRICEKALLMIYVADDILFQSSYPCPLTLPPAP